MDFNISAFGSLTTKAGQTLKFEDFDKDGNLEITDEEYNAVLKENQLDTVELSTIDANGDKVLSDTEFKAFEQKIEMQNAVNEMAKQIARDAKLTSDSNKFVKAMQDGLTEYINDYANNYQGDTTNMAAKFKEDLPKKYTELKEAALKDDPKTIKSAAIEEAVASLENLLKATNPDLTDEQKEIAIKKLSASIDKEAATFVNNYKGNNLKADLTQHLIEFVKSSDKEKMQGAMETFENDVKSLGGYIDSDELEVLKDMAKELLTEAVNKGITVTINGSNIKTLGAVDTILKRYTDAETLLADIRAAIDGLSDENLAQSSLNDAAKTIEENEAKATAEEDKKFSAIKGEEYQVDTSLVDYSKIDGYHSNEHVKSEGSYDAKNTARKLLDSDELKSQIKTQLENMLKEKGIPFDKIATIFERVYNDSIQETIDNCIKKQGSKKFLGIKVKEQTASYNTKDLVDTFITTFNGKIAAAVNEMNTSNTDMDLVDIDLSVCNDNEDEDGKNPLNSLPDINVAYSKGSVLSPSLLNKNKAKEQLGEMLDKLVPQMRAKAEAMCIANGIKFDNKVFNTISNNNKAEALLLVEKTSLLKGTPIREIIDTYTTGIKEDYTNWVNGEKNKKV